MVRPETTEDGAEEFTKGDWPLLDMPEVKKLSLKPGDALVLKVDDRRLKQNVVESYTESLVSMFPGHDVVVIGHGAELEVVEREPTQYRVRLRGGPYGGQTQLSRELNIIERFASRAIPVDPAEWSTYVGYRRTVDLEDGLIVYEYADDQQVEEPGTRGGGSASRKSC